MEHVNFVKLTDAYNANVECDESRNYFFEDDGTCKLCGLEGSLNCKNKSIYQ